MVLFHAASKAFLANHQTFKIVYDRNTIFMSDRDDSYITYLSVYLGFLDPLPTS